MSKAWQSEKTPSTGTPAQRRRGSLRIGRLLPKEARLAFRRQGFAETAVLTRWPEVVGPEMARRSIPERLRFPRGKRSGGTLTIRVDGPFATEVQHLEPLLIEKINAFYGYKAVARVAIVQGPLPRQSTRRSIASRELPEADRKKLLRSLQSTHDQGLKGALLRLGQSIMADRPGRGPDED